MRFILYLNLLASCIYSIYGEDGDSGNSSFFAYIKMEGNDCLEACGGALIAPNYVLTAAKCVQDVDEVTVYLGLTDISNPENITELLVSPSNIKIHPSYDADEDENNIALLELPQSVNTTANITTIKLAYSIWQKPDIFTGKQMNATGFVYTLEEDEERQSNKIKTRPVTKISLSECEDYYEDTSAYDIINDSHICTKRVGGKKTCHDDIGSPLTMSKSGETFLFGIETWYSDDCDPDDPEIYTNVAAHLKWINSTINPKD